MSTRDLLRLTLTPGLGPVLIARLLAAFGSAEAALAASAADLERIKGIGRGKSSSFVRGMNEAAALVDDELALAEKLGITLIPRADPLYPPHLRAIADAPPILYCKGRFDPGAAHQYPVAIVGSRSATAYGIEQSERFASTLAASGLTIVSGGARGIDTAAHRGALRAGGRTIAVLGCGLANCYPPENQPLFDQIAAAGGAVMSELPLRTNPEADNFPARNRLISGISLGIIVIEAGKRSGSLITARLAAEDHGREVMAVPGRVDSPASAGTHDLLMSCRSGGHGGPAPRPPPRGCPHGPLLGQPWRFQLALAPPTRLGASLPGQGRNHGRGPDGGGDRNGQLGTTFCGCAQDPVAA